MCSLSHPNGTCKFSGEKLKHFDLRKKKRESNAECYLQMLGMCVEMVPALVSCSGVFSCVFVLVALSNGANNVAVRLDSPAPVFIDEGWSASPSMV